MPTLQVRSPDGTEQNHPFEEELSVGRAEGNDLVISEGGISRRHARFFVQDGAVWVEDLGSANGTWVDGEKIPQPTQVEPKAQVVIGDYELFLSEEASTVPARSKSNKAKPGTGKAPKDEPPTGLARSTRPAPRTRQISASKMPDGPSAEAKLARRNTPDPTDEHEVPQLRGLIGPWANRVFPVNEKLTVGRIAGQDLVVEDESVSRRHAEVWSTPQGIRIKDLGSSNGTFVNGAKIEGEVTLAAGDAVRFGVIEFMFEDGSASDLPARRQTGGLRAIRSTGGIAAVSRGGGGGSGLKVAIGAVLVVVAVGGAAMALFNPFKHTTAAPEGTNLTAPDPKAELQALLSECRSYASNESGSEPNWTRAQEACNKALDQDPINAEAMALVKKIALEKDAYQNLKAAEKAMTMMREEEALDHLAKIPKESSYYSRVKPAAREAVKTVRERAKDDCEKYAKSGFWSAAYPRCERYMTYACQTMADADLHPPPGYKIELWKRPRKNQWQPRDPMYLTFLRARDKENKGDGPWMCPPVPIAVTDEKPVDPRAEVREALKATFADPRLLHSVELYWLGRTDESIIELQKIRENHAMANLHAQVDQLRQDVAAVENLYKAGSTSLGQNEFDHPAELFNEALSIDKKILGELADKKPSFFRRAIQQSMAQQTYQGGRFWADRSDFRRACKIWKLGYGFYAGNPDLLKAVGFCSGKAGQALDAAESCSDLDQVLDLAVDGDGIKDRVGQKRTELHCG